jgi:hypothetical protein
MKVVFYIFCGFCCLVLQLQNDNHFAACSKNVYEPVSHTLVQGTDPRSDAATSPTVVFSVWSEQTVAGGVGRYPT